jgi:hypothetical protein
VDTELVYASFARLQASGRFGSDAALVRHLQASLFASSSDGSSADEDADDDDSRVIAAAYKTARTSGQFDSDEELLRHLKAVCAPPPDERRQASNERRRSSEPRAIVMEFELASSISAPILPPAWAVAATNANGPAANPFAGAKAGRPNPFGSNDSRGKTEAASLVSSPLHAARKQHEEQLQSSPSRAGGADFEELRHLGSGAFASCSVVSARSCVAVLQCALQRALQCALQYAWHCSVCWQRVRIAFASCNTR